MFVKHGSLVRGRRTVTALAGAALLIAGCGASGGSPSAAAPEPSAPAASDAAGEAYVVEVATDPALGDILVGEGGKTLYIFTKDTGGKSVCNGDCATAWPPFVLADGETVVPGDGVTGALATITRDDGAMQVTFAGAPLYYFAADAQEGDVKGQGVKDVWFVVSPSGSSVRAGGATGGSPTTTDAYTRGGGSPTTVPGPAAGPAATIVDFAFSPATVTVPVGTTITWTNTGAKPHTVTADDGSFASGTLAGADTFSQAFPTAGTYAYHCAIHGQMVGSVVVTP